MCPECKKLMIVIELDAIEVDHCLICRGTWLDAGEIEAITERTGASTGRLSEALRSARTGKRNDRRCPRCRRRMRTIHLDCPEELELDYCPLEHGLWFDQGEMKTLISTCAEGEEGAVASFFTDLYRSELDIETKGE